jgi:hypothetical protein
MPAGIRALISSKCHGRKSWVSTPTSMEREFGHLWQTSVGMAEEVRRSAIGTVPDAQGIVTEHDQLAVDRNAARLSSQENSSFNLRACLS